MSQIDLNRNSLSILTAGTGAQESHGSTAPPIARTARGESAEGNKRSWIGRALESMVYGILIFPFAVVVCAIVAFAILPLHSDSRCDEGYE